MRIAALILMLSTAFPVHAAPLLSACQSEFAVEFYEGSMPEEILTNVMKEIGQLSEMAEAIHVRSSLPTVATPLSLRLQELAGLFRKSRHGVVDCAALAVIHDNLTAHIERVGETYFIQTQKISQAMYYPGTLPLDLRAWASYVLETGAMINR